MGHGDDPCRLCRSGHRHSDTETRLSHWSNVPHNQRQANQSQVAENDNDRDIHKEKHLGEDKEEIRELKGLFQYRD